MPSEEEQQPGPSGISREELLTLSGLKTSDDEDEDEEEEQDLGCYETLDDSEEEDGAQQSGQRTRGGWCNKINQSQVALEWLTWCDCQLRQQALSQLTPEDLEVKDRMVRAYPDHPHPAYRLIITCSTWATRASITSLEPHSPWTVSIPRPAPSMNFTGVSGTVVPSVILYAMKNICVSVTAPCKTSTKRPKPKWLPFARKGTTCTKCGNASGPNSSKPTPTSKRTWTPCSSWHHSTLVTRRGQTTPSMFH